MLTFELHIESDNDAFSSESASRAEVLRILWAVMEKIKEGGEGAELDGYPNMIRDVNGNRIGFWGAEYSEAEDETV